MSAAATAARTVEAARGWIGTPFVHRASVKGAGCDCVGLVRGVWREVCGDEPEAVPVYAPLWAERASGEMLGEALARHMRVVAVREAAAGDVVLFRLRAGGPAQHAAILSAPNRMIHAYGGRAVVETALGAWWRRRMVAAFGFPLATHRQHCRHGRP